MASSLPITTDDVAKGIVTWMKLPATESGNDEVKMVAGATLAYVRGLPVWHGAPDDAEGQASHADQVRLGCAMLGARLYRRRNSPNGVEGITDQGTSYVARHDPDVSRLLELDSYVRPAVG